MNKMQLRANLVDPNTLIGEIARAGGKTEGLLNTRLINVGFSMPGELSFLVHKTYSAAMINMVPAILASFKKPVGEKQEPMMREGIDYVVGSTKLPDHFMEPIYGITNPKHSIVFRNGHHFQLVSSDQPESMAGRSGVHAFIEEAKHQNGEKVTTRILPGLRGGTAKNRQSAYYQGITAITDAARVDLGENTWYQRFNENMNDELINEIATVAKYVNDAQVKKIYLENLIHETTNLDELSKHRKNLAKQNHVMKMWLPILTRMRKAATFYISASSFVNKDILGINFFKTQLESLTEDEFLTAICNIAPKQVVNMFFGNFKKSKHCFTDSYKDQLIYNLDLLELSDNFKLNAHYIKHYTPQDPLILMYDPGHFSSVIAGQFDKKNNTLWILKEFFVYTPKNQSHLAREIYDYFGTEAKNMRIDLFYDRAGNKRREIQHLITTDAKQLKFELDCLSFKTRLKNEKQRTIFYSEHHKLGLILFGEERKEIPRIRIDENECPNLISAIHLSPLRKKDDGRIELDKTSEEKVALPYQAGLTTQLPSALTYGLYGLFSNFLPQNFKKKQSHPIGIN
jgi:hypothetical protein